MIRWLLNWFGPGDRPAASQTQVRLLEKKLEALLADLGVPTEDEERPSLPATVQHALRRGDTLGAIRLYRKQTGANLAEAKSRVEGKGASGTDIGRSIELIDRALEAHGIDFDPYPGLDERIALEARTSGKISAIKMYRRETGADLREAKEAVESIMRG